MTTARVVFVGGRIAYRALFNWLHPAIYIPTMLGTPLFQILFFASLGRHSGLADDGFSWSATPCRPRPWPACTGWS
jgi:ABC-2 type transport system permease protein